METFKIIHIDITKGIIKKKDIILVRYIFPRPEYAFWVYGCGCVCVYIHIFYFKYLYTYHTFLKISKTFKQLAKNMAFKISQNKCRQDYPA